MSVPRCYVSKPTINTNSKTDQHENKLPLALTRRILSLLGALPCSTKSPYWPSFDKKEANVFYSAALLTIFTWNVLWKIVSKKIQYDETDPSKFLLKLLTFETIILMVPHAIVYLLWADVPRLNEYMKIFLKLQENFKKITGKSLKNRKLTIEKFLSLSTLVAVPAFYYLCSFHMPLDQAPLVATAVLYGNMMGVYVVIYWNIASMCIVDALEDIQLEFKKSLQSDKLTANIVFEFRLLWLSLRAACDSMSQWQSTSFGYTMCLGLSVVMLHRGLSLLQDGEVPASLGHFAAGFLYAIVVYLSCRASHEVQEKMKCLVKEILPNISLSSYNPGIQREIVMLYVVESCRPVVTTFRGMLTVNRHTLLSFFSNVSTYIIVLMQFIPKN